MHSVTQQWRTLAVSLTLVFLLAGCVNATPGTALSDDISNGSAAQQHHPNAGGADGGPADGDLVSDEGDDGGGSATTNASAASGTTGGSDVAEAPAGSVVMVLAARTIDGSALSSEVLAQAATLLRARLSNVPDAVVDVWGQDKLRITAPGSDPAVLDGADRSWAFAMRPVVTLGLNPEVMGEESSGVAEFPSGGATDRPTQPDDHGDLADRWVRDARTLVEEHRGPTCSEMTIYQGLDDPSGPLLACDQEEQTVYLLDSAELESADIDSAGVHDVDGSRTVEVTLTPAGSEIIADYTTSHVGAQLAYVLDGVVITAPVVSAPIQTPTLVVSGSFSEETAGAIAASLNFAALQLSLTVEELTVVN